MLNKKETKAKELFDLLESISKYIDKKIEMYALGGTALTILEIKPSTLDIDICIYSQKDYDYICEVFEDIGFKRIGTMRWQTQEGLFFDLFIGSNILGTQLLFDFTDKAKSIRSFKSLYLYTFSLYDIIITKLARGDQRDFEDIKSIFETQEIFLDELVKRYKDTMENSIVANYRQKILDLIEIKFKEWGYNIDSKIIEEVKRWEEI